MQASSLDRFFQDDKGNVVIIQPPNIPITVWAIASVLKLVANNGSLYATLDAISYGSIFVWSLMELFQGVNTFRRTLGLVVLVATIVSRL
jgi:hypothetical protein